MHRGNRNGAGGDEEAQKRWMRNRQAPLAETGVELQRLFEKSKAFPIAESRGPTRCATLRPRPMPSVPPCLHAPQSQFTTRHTDRLSQGGGRVRREGGGKWCSVMPDKRTNGCSSSRRGFRISLMTLTSDTNQGLAWQSNVGRGMVMSWWGAAWNGVMSDDSPGEIRVTVQHFTFAQHPQPTASRAPHHAPATV